MTSVTLPTHRFTATDLAGMPDDGNRYELVDGALIVTPAPVPRHQRVSGRLFLALCAACPAGLEVFAAPFEVRLAPNAVVQPDLVVVDPDALDETGLTGPPLLAVEILSPSTRLIDLGLKKTRYELAGCPTYWAVDPGDDGGQPWIRAWELHDGRYVQAGHSVGESAFHTHRPFEIDVVPSDLARQSGGRPPRDPGTLGA
ncbi:Uma2 family endonuclease [Mobilicoccus massiliensis]|uniref:Uma2 family endonuclease n=1 Tax=Mobilicoccus massiliensis TaxID=1522310 RepID=UPI000693F496|nr:Uma2 family endonuclease [Mobilicoccus massiliensis]